MCFHTGFRLKTFQCKILYIIYKYIFDSLHDESCKHIINDLYDDVIFIIVSLHEYRLLHLINVNVDTFDNNVLSMQTNDSSIHYM